MRKVEFAKQQNIEMSILRNIKRLSKGIDVLVQMQIELMSCRSQLRNKIMVYQDQNTQAEIDDLLFAIIRDKALPREEIQIAFDYNDTRYAKALQRLNEDHRL